MGNVSFRILPNERNHYRPRTLRLLSLCCVWITLADAATVFPQGVPTFSRRDAVAFSKDGILVAYAVGNHLLLIDRPSSTLRWNAVVEVGYIGALSFSHDGRRLAVAVCHFRELSPLGEPRKRFVAVLILDAATGRKEEEIVNDKAEVIWDLSYSADGSLLAVVSHPESEILLWHVTGTRTTTLVAAGSLPSGPQVVGSFSAIFAPEGNALAWAMVKRKRPSDEFEVRVLDTATLSGSRVAHGNTSRFPLVLAFSNDGESLAFATGDWNRSSKQPTHITIYSRSSRKVTRRIKTAEIVVSSLVFSADGRSILGVGMEGILSGVVPTDFLRRMCLWDSTTGKLQKKVEEAYPWTATPTVGTKTLRVPSSDLYFCPHPQANLSFYDSNSLQLRTRIPLSDPASGAPTSYKIPINLRNLRYAASAHRILALSFVSGMQLMTGSSNGVVRYWPIPPVKSPVQQQLDVKPDVVAFSPAPRTIAVSENSTPGVAIVDAASGKLVRTLPEFSGSASALAYSPDAASLAAAAGDGSIRIFDALSCRLKATLTGHEGAVASLAFSSNSSLLASGGDDHILRIWDVKSGALVHTLAGHRNKISVIAFGTDKSTLASASAADGSVMIWNLKSGKNPIRLRGHVGAIRGLAFSPDGSRLAGAGDETICLWNSSSGKRDRILALGAATARRLYRRDPTIATFRDTMTVVAWSPDGTVMACGGFNNSILLWEASTWKQRTLR
jgi:WD40 repeat protein